MTEKFTVFNAIAIGFDKIFKNFWNFSKSLWILILFYAWSRISIFVAFLMSPHAGLVKNIFSYDGFFRFVLGIRQFEHYLFYGRDDYSFYRFFAYISIIIGVTWLFAALNQLKIKLYHDKSFGYQDLLYTAKRLPQFLVVTLLFLALFVLSLILIVFIGAFMYVMYIRLVTDVKYTIIICTIPVLLSSIYLLFYILCSFDYIFYLILDQQQSVFRSFSYSLYLTKGNRFTIFRYKLLSWFVIITLPFLLFFFFFLPKLLLGLLAIGIYIFGYLACGIGQFYGYKIASKQKHISYE